MVDEALEYLFQLVRFAVVATVVASTPPAQEPCTKLYVAAYTTCELKEKILLTIKRAAKNIETDV